AGGFLEAGGGGPGLPQPAPPKGEGGAAVAGPGGPPLPLPHSRGREGGGGHRGDYLSPAMGYHARAMKKHLTDPPRHPQRAGTNTAWLLRDHPTNEQRLKDIDSEIARTAPEVLAMKPEQFRAPPGPGDRFVKIVKALQAKAPAHAKNDQAERLLAKSPS